MIDWPAIAAAHRARAAAYREDGREDMAQWQDIETKRAEQWGRMETRRTGLIRGDLGQEA
jgi:hypothetical protein